MSFDIRFTRKGFENACWHREACRAIQHAFSKPSLVNFISKGANLVFYLSVYPLLNTVQTNDYDVIFYFCVDSASFATSFKSATSSWPDKGNKETFIRFCWNYSVNIRGDCKRELLDELTSACQIQTSGTNSQMIFCSTNKLFCWYNLFNVPSQKQ